jgi:23S rRNA A1618 N6-methylase RlmF
VVPDYWYINCLPSYGLEIGTGCSLMPLVGVLSCSYGYWGAPDYWYINCLSSFGLEIGTGCSLMPLVGVLSCSYGYWGTTVTFSKKDIRSCGFLFNLLANRESIFAQNYL